MVDSFKERIRDWAIYVFYSTVVYALAAGTYLIRSFRDFRSLRVLLVACINIQVRYGDGELS